MAEKEEDRESGFVSEEYSDRFLLLVQCILLGLFVVCIIWSVSSRWRYVGLFSLFLIIFLSILRAKRISDRYERERGDSLASSLAPNDLKIFRRVLVSLIVILGLPSVLVLILFGWYTASLCLLFPVFIFLLFGKAFEWW